MGLLNAVVDLSHHNAVASFAEARAAGLVGVIHKATQGTEFADAMYDEHRAGARAAGLLWGAYHFASAGNVQTQVEHFLSVANLGSDEVAVLDFEPNSRDGNMTLAEAELFVRAVQAKTGRFPGLYSGQTFLSQMVGQSTTTPLANCWLWVARYGPVEPQVPPAWPGYTLWQYTDGNSGLQPHQVPGIGRCDRDKFNGDERTLRARWKTGFLGKPAAAAGGTGVGRTRRKASGTARNG